MKDYIACPWLSRIYHKEQRDQGYGVWNSAWLDGELWSWRFRVFGFPSFCGGMGLHSVQVDTAKVADKRQLIDKLSWTERGASFRKNGSFVWHEGRFVSEEDTLALIGSWNGWLTNWVVDSDWLNVFFKIPEGPPEYETPSGWTSIDYIYMLMAHDVMAVSHHMNRRAVFFTDETEESTIKLYDTFYTLNSNHSRRVFLPGYLSTLNVNLDHRNRDREKVGVWSKDFTYACERAVDVTIAGSEGPQLQMKDLEFNNPNSGHDVRTAMLVLPAWRRGGRVDPERIEQYTEYQREGHTWATTVAPLSCWSN